MFCCNSCIQDEELDKLFRAVGVRDDCGYCDKEDVFVIEVSKLRSKIEPLLEHYKPVDDIDLFQSEDKNFSKGNIVDQINEDWDDIFCSDDDEKLLKDILGKDSDNYEKLFKNNVLLELKFEEKNRKRNIEREELWDTFKKEIKENFRYRRVESNEIEEFSNLLKHLVVALPIETKLYRARISDESGYNCNKMWAPDSNKSTAGRANPKGISYLYLSRDEVTTIYELRAVLHDYVTVGTFRTTGKIHVVKFRPVKKISPFLLSDVQLLDIIEYDSFIRNLMTDLSKPNRRFDSDVDYIPTQYIVEMAKGLHGIEGVEFPSSMHADGRNIVLFDNEKVDCIDTKVYTINNIKYDYS